MSIANKPRKNFFCCVCIDSILEKGKALKLNKIITVMMMVKLNNPKIKSGKACQCQMLNINTETRH